MTQKRRVLLLADGLGNGGAERQLILLAKCLPLQWERRVFSIGAGPYTQVLRENDIQLDIHQRVWRFDARPAITLLKLIQVWRPDVIHSWGWLSSALVAPLCRLMHIPWIDGSIRVGWQTRDHRLRARMALGMADRVIANSKAGLTAWQIPACKGRVIYNGVDPDRFTQIGPNENKNTPFTVVMAARMSPVKDFDSFINAARIVLSADLSRKYRFLAVGAGSNRVDLVRRSSDLISQGCVAFPDAGIEVMPYLQQSDVGVLMTNPRLLAEGCSNSILEYMACGLPVICSDSGGNCEVVLNGETGFVIPSLDAQALADKILLLAKNQPLAEQMGRAGRTRLQQNFTVQKLVSGTVSLYEELLH